jgi:hypothetical protein
MGTATGTGRDSLCSACLHVVPYMLMLAASPIVYRVRQIATGGQNRRSHRMLTLSDQLLIQI